MEAEQEGRVATGGEEAEEDQHRDGGRESCHRNSLNLKTHALLGVFSGLRGVFF